MPASSVIPGSSVTPSPPSTIWIRVFRLVASTRDSAGGDGVVAQAVPFLQQQHLARVESPEGDALLPDRGIAFAGHERELVLEELAHVEIARLEGQRDQRDVEPARAQPLDQAIREVLAQEELQLSVGAPQPRKHAGQQEGRDGGDGAQAQRPGERTRRGAGRLRQVRRRRQQLAPARGDILAHRGEPYVAFVALHELRAQEGLQLLDPGGQRGLSHELRFRGGPEVQARGELDQVGELA
jgi:hypothetical protein